MISNRFGGAVIRMKSLNKADHEVLKAIEDGRSPFAVKRDALIVIKSLNTLKKTGLLELGPNGWRRRLWPMLPLVS